MACPVKDPLPLLGEHAPTGIGGIDRRDFLKRTCILAAAAVGLPKSAAAAFQEAAEAGIRPPVIWLSFQECTGCTETLLRTSAPRLDEIVLDLISLEYHEALHAAAGHQVEQNRREAMEKYAGQYICVAEGSIPTKDGGIYCQIGGMTALEMLEETAADAAAVIGIGSCASWGGIPSSHPNPTGAKGAPEILSDRTVVSIPGCPPNPYNFLGTVLQYATYGTLPALDDRGRPKWAYGRTIHEHCPRRAHFDAGRFAQEFGDSGHREGWCLYMLGCKGPETYANCSTQHYNEVPDAWPIGTGHPCFGCTMEDVAFTKPLHETAEILDPRPPYAYPPIETVKHEGISPWATGAAGLALGGLAGAGYMASREMSEAEATAGEAPPGESPTPPETEER